MIQSTIFDGVYGWFADKVKIEDCMDYKKFCECKEKFLAELSPELQKKFEDLLYLFGTMHEELTYQQNMISQNYGIKIGMELQEFFNSLLE